MVIKWVTAYFVQESLPRGVGSLSTLNKHYLQTWCIYQGFYKRLVYLQMCRKNK